MWWIRVNVNQKVNRAIVKERDTRNISMIENVFYFRKTKLQKSDVYVQYDSWRVVIIWEIPGKDNPVRMVWNPYQLFSILIQQTWNGMNKRPW